MPRKKKSLGRDAFEQQNDKAESRALKQLISGKGLRPVSEPKEMEVTVKLTPSNIRKLDELRRKLKETGKGVYTRNELIRIAITLLSTEDF